MKSCLKDVKGCVFQKDCPNTGFPMLLTETTLKMQAEITHPALGTLAWRMAVTMLASFFPTSPP